MNANKIKEVLEKIEDIKYDVSQLQQHIDWTCENLTNALYDLEEHINDNNKISDQ